MKTFYLFVIFRLYEITGTVEDFPPGDFLKKLVVAIVVAVGGVELLFKSRFVQRHPDTSFSCRGR